MSRVVILATATLLLLIVSLAGCSAGSAQGFDPPDAGADARVTSAATSPADASDPDAGPASIGITIECAEPDGAPMPCFGDGDAGDAGDVR